MWTRSTIEYVLKFGNFGKLNFLFDGNKNSQINRSNMFKSTCIAPIDAETDDIDPPIDKVFGKLVN